MVTPEKRGDAVEKLIDEVEKIIEPLDETRHPDLGQRLRWFSRKGLFIIAPPQESNPRLGDEFPVIYEMAGRKNKIDGKNPLFLYPILQADRHHGEAAAYFVRRVFFGSYGPESHTIFINMESCETLRFIACVLLHELGHAHAAEMEKRAGKVYRRPFGERLAEEVKMWTVEYKLNLAVGGERYQAQAKKGALQYYQELRQKIPLSWTGLGAALDDCFGPPPCDEATQKRDATFKIYCQLMACDIFSPDTATALRDKMEVMRTHYFPERTL